MTIRQLRWLLLIVIVLVAAGFIVHWNRQRSIRFIPTATVERQNIHTGVTTNGQAEPVHYRDVRAAIDGQVSLVPVRDGDEVGRGQRLMTINQRQIESEVERERAQLADAEDALRLLRQGGSSLDRSELRAQIASAQREKDQAAKLVAQDERLIQSGAIARVDLQQARNRLAKAESDLAVLQQKLHHRYDPQEIAKAEAAVQADRAALNLAESRRRASIVNSPIRGTIYSLSVRPGDYAKVGELLVRVGDFRRIRVRVYVDEPDLGKVKKGQQALVSWDGLPGREWRGKVDRLPSEIKQLGTRRVGEVSCVVDNPTLELLPNMNLNVSIITASKAGVLTLPREALFGTQRNRQVYIVRKGKLARQTVQTGISNPTRVEIRSGLKEGEEVALASEVPLHEGMRVRTDGT